METKFTPGPWESATAMVYRDGKPVVTEYFVCTEDGDVAIASEIVNIEDGSPSEANAHLIAAAPDLFGALEDLIGCIATDGNLTGALNAACLATAKARGEK